MSIDLRDINNHRHLHGQRPMSESGGQSGRSQSATRTDDDTQAGEQVRLSNTARSMKALEESVQASDGVDAGKVERIRAQIAEGRYHVDADKLAGRMIDLERVLLG